MYIGITCIHTHAYAKQTDDVDNDNIEKTAFLIILVTG